LLKSLTKKSSFPAIFRVKPQLNTMKPSAKFFMTFFSLFTICFFTLSAQTNDQKLSEQFASIDFRFIGPGQAGGRISDIEVTEDESQTIYMSAATGGIFRSNDKCVSWVPIFDQAGSSLSIGDMAISKIKPGLIWAGTGEASGEQSSASLGDGVYKSDDGGDSWMNMGLERTGHISRIRIDELNPDIVYVAATGNRWGETPDRGIFKTMNGGQTWEKILFVDGNTGFSDIVVHPEGKIILASAWFQRRNAWAHVQTGPGSGLYRSSDAGQTWTKLDISADKSLGRIALWMAPSNPEIIYACFESKSGGLYRSDDAGASWKLVNEKQSTSYWYGRLYGDPTDSDHIFVMGVNINESTDGGKTFNRMPARGVHVDHHILWLSQDNTDYRLLGNDGGLYVTENGGDNWSFVSNMAIGQNYAISLDSNVPYNVYGGLQDNGVWGGPSRSESEYMVTNTDIVRVSGGDGFYSATHPVLTHYVFGESQYGFIVRRDFRTGSSEMVKPKSKDDAKDVFNWNTPFFISTHPPHSLYIGGNFIFKSSDLGDNWKKISPDLSRQKDLSKQRVLDQKPVLKPYQSVTALAESPLKPGYLLAGTDDGLLHISFDDGENWTNISDRLNMPPDRFFTRVMWSVADVGTAYVACARYYEANDFSPYLFKTNDFGSTWVKITMGFDEHDVIKGLCEHPNNPDLLFAGTHNDLYISVNGGNSWMSPNWNLPPVAIDDIKLAFPENDLVLGSYGRGIIILDNIDFLAGINQDLLKKPMYLFPPKPYTLSPDPIKNENSVEYSWHAPNPPSGLTLDCYIGEDRTVTAGIELLDLDGLVLFAQEVTLIKGFNRWNIPASALKQRASYVRIFNDNLVIERSIQAK
jgi:photosystem II stability/assembly factor-like uncharacterized protein